MSCQAISLPKPVSTIVSRYHDDLAPGDAIIGSRSQHPLPSPRKERTIRCGHRGSHADHRACIDRRRCAAHRQCVGSMALRLRSVGDEGMACNGLSSTLVRRCAGDAEWYRRAARVLHSALSQFRQVRGGHQRERLLLAVETHGSSTARSAQRKGIGLEGHLAFSLRRAVENADPRTTGACRKQRSC